MLFDRELAERICREMGIEYHPEQEGVLVGGKKLPDNFSTEKLFRGEYDFDYEGSFAETVVSMDISVRADQVFSHDCLDVALAA